MFNDMSIPHATKCERQQFPLLLLLFINFRNGKLCRYLNTANIGKQRNAVPDNSGIINKLNGNIVHIGFLIPDTSCLDDFKFLILFPCATHMYKF